MVDTMAELKEALDAQTRTLTQSMTEVKHEVRVLGDRVNVHCSRLALLESE